MCSIFIWPNLVFIFWHLYHVHVFCCVALCCAGLQGEGTEQGMTEWECWSPTCNGQAEFWLEKTPAIRSDPGTLMGNWWAKVEISPTQLIKGLFHWPQSISFYRKMLSPKVSWPTFSIVTDIVWNWLVSLKDSLRCKNLREAFSCFKL